MRIYHRGKPVALQSPSPQIVRGFLFCAIMEDLTLFDADLEATLNIPIECKDNKEYSPSLKHGEGCEQCDHRNFEMVGHPGGSSVHSTERYFCEKGFWKESF